MFVTDQNKVHFIIFINDKPRETVCPIKSFADDAKLFYSITTDGVCKLIQEDLDKLQQWATKWQLKLHPQKCIVLRAGHGHPDFDYFMWDGNERVQLAKSECEKYLGIFEDNTKACRGTEKGTKMSDKENSFIGKIRV